ncbi:hypothetical protein GCM10010885_01880 [Alicyclobacillus cellulosilyticus]|uniref:Uncharacterized protein n=1 Tax=Alicyclobacillus cellulosilyticus TaxID=1003997 RepID=A0A917NGG1_9BACL|nr:hypothetical protein [Alicyclobacillus cellulosilyticus]GGI95829.1 hypothetical protein GCM10010885_01880 [Alicyclobacillus cellulosilyticus]
MSREARARAWLEQRGYHIVREGARAEWIGYVDARAFRKVLVADFLVAKGPRRYVVKLSNPMQPGPPMNGSRLREDVYPLAVAFAANGVLWMDPDRQTVHEMDFEVRSPASVVWRRFGHRAGWLLSGALLMFIWLHRA